MMRCTLLLLITIIASYYSLAQKQYLHCGNLIDTESGKVLPNMTIIIDGNTIESVQKGFINPNDITTKIIDLSKKTVMPGFIDMHVHLEFEYDKNARLNRYILNEADIALNSVINAKNTLFAGFTSVRDLGGTGVNIALKKAINIKKIDGPRIFTSGKSLASTGGHADPTNGSKKILMGDLGPKEGVVNSVEDAKKAVRQRYKNGADWIKITATGGVLSVAKSGDNPQFTIEEIKAICQTAKDYGMQVAAHAHGDLGMQRAILGGVKTIEHGTHMSDKTMELMKKHNVFLVPTIAAGKEVATKAEIKGFYPKIVVPKAKAVGPKMQKTFKRAYKKGVSIAFGTDAGVFNHGNNAMEFIYMTEVGYSPMKAIQSATITNAKVLQVENKLGKIAKGYLADIIAVSDDPTKDIKTLLNVNFVMKDGDVFKNE